jgi:hypothetical protein
MSKPNRRWSAIGTVSLATAMAALALTPGCTTTYPNTDPTSLNFPDVEGEDLNGELHQLPAEHAGQPVLYLVGTVQDAQFDIDRWLLGLLQAETPVTFAEVPTIAGLFPSLFLEDVINDGMREGIPSEDWGGVITLYSDSAQRLVKLLGNETPRNARVLLLNAEGRIVWFHDRGYSPRVLLELDRVVRNLEAP